MARQRQFDPEDPKDFAQLALLKDMSVAMYVGDGDGYWRDGMIKARDRLAEVGNETYLKILPLNSHFLPDLTGENTRRLFDHLE
ncbi:MAG: hypothetical protein QF738_00095 [Rhodospirillales bacterium]|jgi:hypothetical protein|nr:hypothetical protein [Rhodospirillales bacterium]